METVSPVTVVMVSSILTIAGWLVWDMGWEQREAAKERAISVRDMPSTPAITPAVTPSTSKGLGVDLGPDGKRNSGSYFPPMEPEKPASVPAMDGDHSAQLRKSRILATAKSALLIYCTYPPFSPSHKTCLTRFSYITRIIPNPPFAYKRCYFRQYLGHSNMAIHCQLPKFRLWKWHRTQLSRIFFDQCGYHVFCRAGLPTYRYVTCVFTHAVQYPSLWTLPSIPENSETSIMELSCPVDNSTRVGCGRRIVGSCWKRLGGCVVVWCYCGDGRLWLVDD
jgi:hypothetical protein